MLVHELCNFNIIFIDMLCCSINLLYKIVVAMEFPIYKIVVAMEFPIVKYFGYCS